MPPLRSRTSTHGRNMTGARALWRATGMADSDFGRPVVAIANSYTQFVPGHVHLEDMGDLVASAVVATGGVAKEFSTIAVDDGTAMGHAGMLHSLPSRELIADSVEYVVNAHTADALVCISNCDKHPRHADGRIPAEHPGGLRLRWSDGSRQSGHRRSRNRVVSRALQAYVSMASSASTGAVRQVPPRQHRT